MWLIVGLGNPGSKYARTPHNLGFDCVDGLVRRHKLDWQDARRFQGVMAAGSFNGEKLYFLKPMTYMNLSGASVQPCADYYKIPPENVLAICDDINLPWGKIRLRPSGSHGGHNGLRDLIARLGTENFPRLRIGCAPMRPPRDMAEYVLSPAWGEAAEIAPLALGAAEDAVESILRDGLPKAMSLFNAWKLPETK